MIPRKVLSIIITSTVILSSCLSLCACKSDPHPVPESDIPTITILTGKVNTEDFDGDLVARTLDEYLLPLLNAHVNIEFIEFERSDQILEQYLASDNKPDLFMSFLSHFIERMAGKGDLYPLDDFLTGDGKVISDLFEDKELLFTHTYNGHVYAIPTLADRSQAVCLEYKESIADQYHLPMDQIHTIEDLTEIFQLLHDQTDEIIPIYQVDWPTYDPLSDSLGILENYGQSVQVVNLYDTENYKNLCRMAKEWKNEGYFTPLDSTSAINSFMRSPWIFSRLRTYTPNLPYMDSADAGETIKCIVLSDEFVYTDILKRLCWAVSASTKYPEIACRFLQLMYTDPTVMNILSYGVEGIHYQVIDAEKDIIGFTDGLNIYNSGYAQFKSYFYGNEFISSLWDGYPVDLWNQIQETNRNAIRSKAYGFTYDPQPVMEEVNCCRYIVSRYNPILMAGVGDTEKLLEEFNQKLIDAGINKIIKEKQKQLDEWLKGEEHE